MSRIGSGGKPTRDRVSELIGDWLKVIPVDIGDGRHVMREFVENLWVTPFFDAEHHRERLRKADQKDRESQLPHRIMGSSQCGPV